MKSIALIPARGGSKGLPGKNIIDLAGKPLIAYSIEAAQNSQKFEKIIVSTDDDAIKEAALSFGAEVIDRPAGLAKDTSTTDSVISHVIEELNEVDFDVITLLQPTSPLRTADHIKEAYEVHKSHSGNMTMSVYEPEECIFKAFKSLESGELSGYFSKDAPFRPRQEFEKVYLPNGAIYIFSKEAFLSENKIPRTGIYPYKMLASESHDIDTKDDLVMIEAIMKMH